MGELQIQQPFTLPPPPPLPNQPPPSETPLAAVNPPSSEKTPPPFDPTRMIGIVKRKTLIRDLAAAFHSDCLAYCHEILELQNKLDEPFIDIKAPEDSRKETRRPPKRMKKMR